MDIQYWLVGGDVHMGAHYPLCVFTNNARSRTNEAVEARRKRKPDKQFWWRHPHNPRSWSGPESAAAACVTAVRSHEWTPQQRHVWLQSAVAAMWSFLLKLHQSMQCDHTRRNKSWLNRLRSIPPQSRRTCRLVLMRWNLVLISPPIIAVQNEN
jgi:hypothetical protein